MKINWVLPTPDLSGGCRVIATHIERLQRRGHDISCAWTCSKPLSWREKAQYLKRGKRWPSGAAPSSHMDGVQVNTHLVAPWRPIADEDLPDGDVVVGTWWETAEWVAGLSPSKGAKAYFIQHYEAQFQGVPEERAAATWRMPLHKITISQWLTDLARDEFGDTHVSHVPNSVDMDQFHAPPRGRQTRPTVGLLYSTTAFKGLATSIEALEAVAQRFPNLRVVAFGAEPVADYLPLPEGTEFHLRPAQNSIRNFYSQCDVWLCGSRSEGFHLPPLEAMACRCPVVSTRVGGSMDVIEEGVNGHLVPIGDASALADRLTRVLALSDRDWKAMSDAAIDTAARYSWDDAADRFEMALRTAIHRSNSQFPPRQSVLQLH